MSQNQRRKSTPRTRTGCANCRRRRIKCAEERPGCSACARAGWTCPGYSTAASQPAQSLTAYHLPYSVPGSQEERRALHYFAVSASADISAYFHEDFWTRSILQVCQHNAPVRYAVGALSRQHEDAVTSRTEETLRASHAASAGYTKSMKALRRYLNNQPQPDLRVVMMCCAAFFCFELTRGEVGQALRHLHGGTKVLQQLHEGVILPAADRTELIGLFSRMELQATCLDDGLAVAAFGTPISLREILEARRSGHSATKDSAQNAEDHNLLSEYPSLLRRCFVFFLEAAELRQTKADRIPEEARTKRDDLLQEWAEQLNALARKKNASRETSSLRSAIARSQYHALAFRTVLGQSLPTSMPRRAQDVPTLEEITPTMLALAREAISDAAGIDNADGGQEIDVHLGLTPSLLHLALATSHQSVLLECMDLLEACKGMREGLCDTDAVIGLVEVAIDRCHDLSAGSILEQLGEEKASALQGMLESLSLAEDEERRLGSYVKAMLSFG